MATENNNKSYKGVIVITYLIAVACMIVSLCVPFYGNIADREWTTNNAILFIYLPGLFNIAVGRTVFKGEWVAGNSSLSFEKYGKALFGVQVEPLAWALLAYALVVVLSIIFIIPVLAGKKSKNTSAKCAYFIEVLALLVLAFYFIVGMSKYGIDSIVYHYNLVLAAVGTLLMLAIQSITQKKSLGTVKVVLAVLSGVAVLCLYDVGSMVKYLFNANSAINSFEKDVLGAIGSCGGFAQISGETIFGKHGIGLLMDADVLKNAFSGGDGAIKLFNVALIGLAVMTLLNLMFDVIGIATGSKYTKKGFTNPNQKSKIFSLIRYIISFAFAVIAIIALLVAKDGKVGFNLYILALVVLIQLIIAIVRVCRIKGQKERAKLEEELSESEDDEFDEEAEEDEEFVAPVQEEVKQEEKQVQPEPEVHTIVYNVKTVYNGPTDEFIETLSTDEKIEFAKIFLEKSKGEIPKGVPDYEVGGNNEDFFPAIFIQLGKTRQLVSKDLLKKLYVYLNKTKREQK